MSRLVAACCAPWLALLAWAEARCLGSAWWHALSEGFAAQGQDGALHTMAARPTWLWLALPAGFILRAAWSTWFRHREHALAFIDTLEHELTHALFGYLTLNPPVSLKATLQGDGEVLLKGQNALTLLSPYFFPLFAAGMGGLSVLLAAAYQVWGVLLSLALLGNFAFRLMAEYRWRQTDLQAYGLLFSTAFVAALLIAVVGCLLSLLGLVPWSWLKGIPQATWGGLHVMWNFGVEVWHWAWSR